MTHQELMRRAIQLAVDNVKNGGGPFGAVIARNGEIIAEGVNRVTPNHDPTAHAEVQAIRAAAARLENFDLAGCSIFLVRTLPHVPWSYLLGTSGPPLFCCNQNGCRTRRIRRCFYLRRTAAAHSRT